MAFIITSRKFYNQFTGTGGGGADYLNTNVGDKVTAVIEGYFFWAVESKNLTFDSATKKISFTSQFESTSFIDKGFNADDTIEIVGSASNPGPFTIAEVSTRYITVVEAVVNEVAQSASIYGTTLVTAMDFYYNLVGNNEAANYISKTDKGSLQRYTCNGLDAAVATPVDMIIATPSYGWVTDILTSGEISQVTVEGDGITDYKQKFIITQKFYHAPMWSKDLLSNFVNRKAPAVYLDGNSVKHVCRIDGKYDYYSPDIAHTGEAANVSGRSAWYNQDALGGKPEYSLVGITYQDFTSLEVLPQLQVKDKTKVTIVLNSRSGKFVDVSAGPTDGSQFVLEHYLCPLNEEDYIGTDTTMLENLRVDVKKFAIGDAAVNGGFYGTDQQSLVNILATFNSVNQVTITFDIDYSAATKAFLQQCADSNRYYVFTVMCHGLTISETRKTDQVNVLCDFNSATYDYRNDGLMGLHDYFHGYPFPNTDINEINNVAGIQGDYFYERVPFWLETLPSGGVSPTLQKVKVQILATKSGEDDFILEEKIFDTSQVRKFDGIQDINIENDRGFILPDDSIYNRANLARRSDLDTGTKAYYEIQYGFALRYETWRQVIQDAFGGAIDVFKDVEDVVQAWERYSQGNGWAMKFRITWDVTGYDDFLTTFEAQTDIKVYDKDSTSDAGPAFTAALSYFDEDDVEMDGIKDEGTTRIVATFTGDPATFPAGFVAHYGYMFFDNDPAGGIFNRLFINSEFDAEETSPFTVEDLPANGAISSYESANLRLSYFADRIELDTFFVNEGDITKFVPSDMIVSPRLGFTKQVGIGQMEIGRTFIVS